MRHIYNQVLVYFLKRPIKCTIFILYLFYSIHLLKQLTLQKIISLKHCLNVRWLKTLWTLEWITYTSFFLKLWALVLVGNAWWWVKKKKKIPQGSTFSKLFKGIHTHIWQYFQRLLWVYLWVVWQAYW